MNDVAVLETIKALQNQIEELKRQMNKRRVKKPRIMLKPEEIERHKLSGTFWISCLSNPITVTQAIRTWDISPGNFTQKKHIGRLLRDIHLLIETEDKRFFVDLSKEEIKKAYKELLKEYYGIEPKFYFKLILDNFDKFICWVEKNKHLFSPNILKQVTDRKALEGMEGFLFPLLVFRLAVSLHILRKTKEFSVKDGIKAFSLGFTTLFPKFKLDFRKYFEEIIDVNTWDSVVGSISECGIDETEYYKYEEKEIPKEILKVIDIAEKLISKVAVTKTD